MPKTRSMMINNSLKNNNKNFLRVTEMSMYGKADVSDVMPS